MQLLINCSDHLLFITVAASTDTSRIEGCATLSDNVSDIASDECYHLVPLLSYAEHFLVPMDSTLDSRRFNLQNCDIILIFYIILCTHDDCCPAHHDW